MSDIKNGGLDHYGPEPFEQQQFGISVVEGVNVWCQSLWRWLIFAILGFEVVVVALTANEIEKRDT